MAVRKYTNRPDVAGTDGWEYATGGVGSRNVDPRNAVDTYYGDPAADPAGSYQGDPYSMTPDDMPYTQELLNQGFTYSGGMWSAPTRTRSGAVGNRAMGGRDLGTIGGGVEDYPKFGETPEQTKQRVASSGGGGQRYKPAVGRVTTRKTTYGEPFPEAPELRGVDKKRIRSLTQKQMAPRMRLLRTALNRALVRSYENPNVRRMIVREALQGYGQGVEFARAGAFREASALEAGERDVENKNLVMAYENALAKHRASGTITETSRDIFDPEEARSVAGGKPKYGFGGGYTGGAGPLGPMKPAQRRSQLV